MIVADRAVSSAATSAAPAPARSPLRRVLGFLLWPFGYLRRAYSLDLRSLALFRIALASVLLGDLIARATDLTAFYTDWGTLPRAALLDRSPAERFSIHLLSGQFVFQTILFAIAGVFALMLLFGVRTRLAAFASWFMVVSVQMRNPVILQGGDVYLRVLAFTAMFLPLGAMYSVDAALDPTPEEQSMARRCAYFSTPGLALMAQIAMLYAFAVMLKTGPEWRRDHSAVFYALSIQQMSAPLGRFLLHFPKLLPWLTRTTLWQEGSIPLLILTPLFSGPARMLAALLILILHTGLGLSIRLGHFPYIACMAALPLLPTWFWNRKWVRRLLPWSSEDAAYGSGVRIYYDKNCPFCSKMVRVLRTFLLIPGAELIPAQEVPRTELEMRQQQSWIVVDPDAKHWYKWQAFAEVISYSPLVSWLAPLLRRAARPGECLYDIVERNRDRLTRWTDWIKPRPMKVKTSWPVTVFALLFIAYISFWNLSSIVRIPGQLFGQAIGLTLSIDQSWDMFSPRPLTYDGWYVIEGQLRDGSHVNVLHPDKPVSYEKPASIADQYKDERWRKYLMNLATPEYADYRLYYSRSLCRSWNTGRWPRDPRTLVNFDIIFMGRQNSITQQDRPYSKDLLWHHECFK
jgi:predicted DCC family thiol-disulfide oxidoreductase YuxK